MDTDLGPVRATRREKKTFINSFLSFPTMMSLLVFNQNSKTTNLRCEMVYQVSRVAEF